MSYSSGSSSARPRKKTGGEKLVDFLTTVGLFALAAGAGYLHAFLTGAFILLVCAYFQRLRLRWDVEGRPSLFERLYAFYKEVRAELDKRRAERERESGEEGAPVLAETAATERA